MDSSSEPDRRHLERVRGALEKVRKVLGDLDQHGHDLAVLLKRAADATPRDETPRRADRSNQLRAHEVAHRLSIPVKEVYAAVRDRRLPATRMGRFLWFRGEDVEAFAKESRRGRGSRKDGAPGT